MPGRRSGRAAAKRAQAALESTPKTFEDLSDLNDDDVAMPDAKGPRVDGHGGERLGDAHAPPASGSNEEKREDAVKDDDDISPAPDEENDEEEEEEAEGEGEGEAEAHGEDDDEEGKSPSPILIRRRRLGRPPKNRPPDWDQLPIDRSPRDPDAPTPRRRGRGGARGGWRGRGGRRGAQMTPTQQSIDKDGNSLPIENDEVVLPEDPEGETKVDKMGNLQGEREYRCRTFKVAGRGDRLYMLSTEPARAVGFRDSYLFFTKHRKLFKIIVNDEEKRDMIERDIIPHSYKGRTIGIVTARSVFREFGAKIVVGGRRIVDDYEVKQAREEGIVEGELASPEDEYNPNEPYDKNKYVAWHGASSVYHSGGPAAPLPSGKTGESKKRRVAVNDMNWQLEHARAAQQFNEILSHSRRAIQHGVYDINTNMMMYPSAMQPTHARIEQVVDHHAAAAAVEDQEPQDGETDKRSAIFPPLSPRVARNRLIVDLHMEQPPAGVSLAAYDVPFRTSATGRKEFAAQVFSTRNNPLGPFRGLAAVSDEIRDLLPEECRRTFDAARSAEDEWFGRWGDEAETTCRRAPVVDKAIVPYSMTLI